MAPEAGGYRDAESRTRTDQLLRQGAAFTLDDLLARVGVLMDAAREEGEEDMLADLTRIGERMSRTAASLRSADHAATVFFTAGEPREEAFTRVFAYDGELLADLDLLAIDVRALRYETIGNLTLREVEGTLAAIELKVANRGDIFQSLENG